VHSDVSCIYDGFLPDGEKGLDRPINGVGEGPIFDRVDERYAYEDKHHYLDSHPRRCPELDRDLAVQQGEDGVLSRGGLYRVVNLRPHNTQRMREPLA
jgi:hypothetical protein